MKIFFLTVVMILILRVFIKIKYKILKYNACIKLQKSDPRKMELKNLKIVGKTLKQTTKRKIRTRTEINIDVRICLMDIINYKKNY